MSNRFDNSDKKSGDNNKNQYKRVLLKLSGEALMGDMNYGLNHDVISSVIRDIKKVRDSGIQVCITVGGGNYFRGAQGEKIGITRASADYMGMLATIMNGLALQSAFESHGVSVRLMSSIPMQSVCEPYSRKKALNHVEHNHVVIFCGGTGSPFFTTDTAALMKAIEMECDVMAKGTKVDGVYSKDPYKYDDAEFYPKLTYNDLIVNDLRVMDQSAIAMAKEHDMPIMVFKLNDQENSFYKTLNHDTKHTYISN